MAQRGAAGSYSAAKAALHGWAYDLARELGPDGITVNVISPGYATGQVLGVNGGSVFGR